MSAEKMLRSRLVASAVSAAGNAYAPYSKLSVGAALLVAGCNLIVTGANVENASYGLTLCAERAALAAAVSAGYRRFAAIAVAASGRRPAVPCGACLQALAEFCGPDLIVLTAAGASPGRVRIFKLRDLLPRAFCFRT
ncbi:MAG: cytidine deaminase [Kiritimatiellae bacterium]|nr:cytidine deaminase [Kiritimatiellia bacterium]